MQLLNVNAPSTVRPNSLREVMSGQHTHTYLHDALGIKPLLPPLPTARQDGTSVQREPNLTECILILYMYRVVGLTAFSLASGISTPGTGRENNHNSLPLVRGQVMQ